MTNYIGSGFREKIEHKQVTAPIEQEETSPQLYFFQLTHFTTSFSCLKMEDQKSGKRKSIIPLLVLELKIWC